MAASASLLLAGFVILTILSAWASAELPGGVKPEDSGLYAGSDLQCKDKTVPMSVVNDDFCDCEADGLDEPGTSACPRGRFWCLNRGFRGLYLPSSRVNDGLCDCCDGSDEPAGVCSNNCAVAAQAAQKETLDAIASIEQGSRTRQEWLSATQMVLQERREEQAKLEKELADLEALYVEAKARKETEEALEKTERTRLQAERDRILAEHLAAQAAAEPQPVSQSEVPNSAADSSSPSLETNQPAASTSSDAANNPPSDAGQPAIGQEGSAFPYPAEYAPPPADSADSQPPIGQEGSAFPYPAEYAAPPASPSPAEPATPESAPAEHLPDELDSLDDVYGHEDDDGDDVVGTEAATTTVPLPNLPPDNYTSEVAEAARVLYREREEARNAAQRKLDDIKAFLALNFGSDGELQPLYDKCFEIRQNQYTYEFCAYKDAKQKEAGRATSLGRFDKLDLEKREMIFTNGQTCWNGPARSLTVKMQCGSENRVLSVEEPSKCFYMMQFTTPALCRQEDAEQLRAKLSQEFPPVHTEL